MSQHSPNAALIAELENTLHTGSNEKRMATLMRVTDLFVNDAGRYSEEQTHLFDDVMGHLVQHVENRALVELSRRLAPVANAPRAVIGQLARNDEIEISGPVLTASERLSDKDLVEIAATKSQAHLAKIAGRARLNEAVTEVLVDRGDDHVANTVANNAGAKFSDSGMAKMVMRADGDNRLAESMLRRADIPPRLFRQLMIQATEAVRLKLLASARPDQKDMIKTVMDELAAQVGKKAPVQARNYADAQRAISAISQDTKLLKSKILEFADADRLPEVIAALSVLSGVSISEIDAIIANELGLTMLCKTVGLEMDTAYAIVMAARMEQPANKQVSDDFCEYYDSLTLASAQRLLRFWQGRQKVAKHFQVNGR